MRCGFADSSWEYYVFDFDLNVPEKCLLCLFLMRSFVVQIFSFFRTLCGLLSHLDVFIVVPFISSTRLAIVAEADLLCGVFLSEKNCRHKLVVSTTFWSWLMNASSVLTSLKWAALIFWLVNALWVCWMFMGFLDFGVYVSEILLFLCLFLMRSFVVQFFSFSRTVCG